MAKARQKLDRAEWAKLPQDVQALYEERNGQYVLDAEDAAELRTAFERQKQELADAKRKLEGMKDVDPDEYQRLKGAAEKAERDKELEKGNFQKIVEQDRAAHLAEVKARDELAAKLRMQLEESLVDGEITRAIAAYPNAKVTPILLGAKRHVVLREINGKERAVVLDEKGEPRLKAGAKSPDEYMTPAELVAEMRNDREWAGNFPASATAAAQQRSPLSVSGSPQSIARREEQERLTQQVRDGQTRVS